METECDYKCESNDTECPVGRSAWQYFTTALCKNYCNFSGRARRKEYWFFTLFSTLIQLGIAFAFLLLLVALILFLASSGEMDESLAENVMMTGMIIFNILMWIPGLAFLLPMLGVAVRRLHDTNRSGWWLLLAFIPCVNIIGTIVLLVFYCQEGTIGPSEYGPDSIPRDDKGLPLD